jgi:Kef-type K+ transport system membrane component KefB
MFGGFPESLTQLPLLARFALALAIILVVPTLCQKVRLPFIVAHLELVLAIVVGLIVSKLLAAQLIRRAFGYSLYQGLVMWSLSLPQVAATLAAALVAFEAVDSQGQRLINEPVLNSVIFLLVVTSILGPILTEQFGNRLAAGPITALATTNNVTVRTA